MRPSSANFGHSPTVPNLVVLRTRLSRRERLPGGLQVRFHEVLRN